MVGAAALSADNNIKQKLAEEVRKREELQKELGLQVREQHNYLGFLQVNLCQKLLLLHQVTHNMTTDRSWNSHEKKRRTWAELVILWVS